MYCKLYEIRKVSLLLAFLVALAPAVLADTKEIFTNYSYGKTPQYYQQSGASRQDVSGSAWDGNRILLAYDGGNDSVDVGVRLFSSQMSNSTFDIPWNEGRLLTRSVMQRDIEGATFFDGSYYTTSSMSLIDEESPGYRLLVEFTLDEKNKKIIWERSVDLRNNLLQAVKGSCNDKVWYARVVNVFGKRGGLNIEGLSYDPDDSNGLVLGLRSPLCSTEFGSPDFGENLSLRNGNAILVKVNKPFNAKPSFKFIKLNLNGHGIRGIEYIPALSGYVIIGGPVEKANDYSLWLYKDNGSLKQLKLNKFDELCRPETVSSILINNKPGIVVYSEEAGTACKDVEFTYIAATIQ